MDSNRLHNDMLPVGTVLNDRYEIREQIGRYGFEQEYLALDWNRGLECRLREFFMLCQVKRTNGEMEVQLPNDRRMQREYENSLRSFFDTACLAGRVQGKPNILSVYDVFRENNTAYYVSEAVEAVDLQTYCKTKGCLEEDEIKYIASQLCRALKELHKESILHLNVIPGHILICLDKEAGENVKLVVNRECKLIDKDFKDKYGPMICCMYPGYCPPEIYESPNQLGTWTDVYMLGATMYEMATGRRIDEATDRYICDNTEAPHELNPQISKRFSDIIMRAIALKRRKRYRDEESLIRDMGGRL